MFLSERYFLIFKSLALIIQSFVPIPLSILSKLRDLFKTFPARSQSFVLTLIQIVIEDISTLGNCRQFVFIN